MVAIENPELIKGRPRLIATYVIDPEEAAEYGSIDEYDESGFREAGVSTNVTEVRTKEVEEVHQAVKYSYLLSFMLKPPFLTHTGI